MKPIEPCEDMQPYINIVIELCKHLDCEVDEIVAEVNQLNMTEYWVENEMLDMCEDNDVMRRVLRKSFNEFMSKHDALGGL